MTAPAQASATLYARVHEELNATNWPSHALFEAAGQAGAGWVLTRRAGAVEVKEHGGGYEWGRLSEYLRVLRRAGYCVVVCLPVRADDVPYLRVSEYES